MKKYIKVKDNSKHITHLRVELLYDLGGTNFFTSEIKERGYYLSVIPVERHTNSQGCATESFTAFTGIKILLNGVARRSKKAENKAEQLAQEKERTLIQYVCAKNKIELDKEN